MEKLGQADEVFISNSIIGIQSISQIGDIGLGESPITKKIKDAFTEKRKTVILGNAFSNNK